MRVEINAALNFLSHYFYSKLPRRRVNVFLDHVEEILVERYRSHWYPEKPSKGSAYRCIKLNSHKSDPLLTEAASKAEFDPGEIFSCLPEDLTIWIDPGEVSYRIGTRGQPIVIHDASQESEQIFSSSDLSCDQISPSPITKVKNHCYECNNRGTPVPFLLKYGAVVKSPFPGRDSASSSRSSPLFTTSNFAKTRFGSTRLKNEYKRAFNTDVTDYCSPGAYRPVLIPQMSTVELPERFRNPYMHTPAVPYEEWKPRFDANLNLNPYFTAFPEYQTRGRIFTYPLQQSQMLTVANNQPSQYHPSNNLYANVLYNSQEFTVPSTEIDTWMLINSNSNAYRQSMMIGPQTIMPQQIDRYYNHVAFQRQ
ncbi:hypothetical protein ACOME3_009064 [Neoechinorhynchus agilis]